MITLSTPRLPSKPKVSVKTHNNDKEKSVLHNKMFSKKTFIEEHYEFLQRFIEEINIAIVITFRKILLRVTVFTKKKSSN